MKTEVSENDEEDEPLTMPSKPSTMTIGTVGTSNAAAGRNFNAKDNTVDHSFSKDFDMSQLRERLNSVVKPGELQAYSNLQGF